MNTNIIIKEMDADKKQGNVYVTIKELYLRCAARDRKLSRQEFSDGVKQLIREGRLTRERNRLYLPAVKGYEDTAARALANLMRENRLAHVPISEKVTVGDIDLTGEQREAVSLALDHPVSVIQGGAGTGKSTLVQAIIQNYPRADGPVLLCAPTGKAACNLQEKTGVRATTVHGAFANAFKEKEVLPYGLVVVDEAGMVSSDMLAWTLASTKKTCRIVFVGDPNQLPSVECGRVMDDLLEIGIPHISLSSCHRQKDVTQALAHNVQNFSGCSKMGDFGFDGSFRFVPCQDDKLIQKHICELAAPMYRDGESVQVLSPYRRGRTLSAADLNRQLQQMVNPCTGREKYPFHDGDRIMVIQNDRTHRVYNGETGILRIVEREEGEPLYQITCGNRQAVYDYKQVMSYLSLAYAATVHKVQGSEYDTVIFPVSKKFSPLMTRNLLYTAISRAKKQVILVGDSETLEYALKNHPAPRRSMLVEKVKYYVSQ